MSTSTARIFISALMGAGMRARAAESIRSAGEPRRLKRVMNDTYDWFGPKGSSGNKYKPHQGAQEIARRLRGKPVSKPRRMWYPGDEDGNLFRYGRFLLRESTRHPLIKTSRILLCSVVLLP